ncbi:MAG: ATP-binding protein [Thermoanaerobaculia bacterium]
MQIHRPDAADHHGARSRIRLGAATGRWTLLAPCALVLVLCTQAVYAKQQIRVGIYENSPKVGTSESGKPEGIFIDLIEAIADAEGWSIEYVPGTWEEGLERLAAGQIDLMPDVALTSERERQFAFHREPVLSSWSQVYARRGSGIRSLPDLQQKRVAVVEGSVQEELFRQMVGAFNLGVIVMPMTDFDTAFRAVAENHADAVVTNRFYGVMHAQAAGLEDTAIIFAPSRLYFAAPKERNLAMLAAIDRHLIAYKKNSSSVYYRSLHKWTEDAVRPAMPRWITFALLGGVALLAAAAGWLLLLRRQVASRTAIIRRRNEQLAIFNRTLRATGASLDLNTVLEEAMRGALELTGCDYGVVCIRDPDAPELRVGARVHGPNCAGPVEDGPLRDVICPSSAAVGALEVRPAVFPAAARGTSPVRDLVSDPLMRWTAYFPLAAHGTAVGVMCLFSRRDEPPSSRDVDLVRELSVPVALAMENARLYAQAREHADELEHRVAERTRELAEAKHAAESADRIKSAFLATMSHELRTPLNSIIGFTGIVCQGLAGPLSDEQKRQLGMVRESAQHLLALINDVLDISKIEAGELVVAAEPFDLPTAIRKVAGIVGPLAEKKGLSMAIDVDARIGSIVGDSRRVEQVLINLLGNAVKFTEHGSVALTAEPFADYVAGDGKVPAVRLRVSDTGIGIQPEEMAKLFQPFRQIDSTISRKHEGTGLGLAICRRLTALMGGRIEAESRYGDGSVFTVFLPVQPPRTSEDS